MISYNPYKAGPLQSLQVELWGPYQWVTGVTGVTTPLVTGRGRNPFLESQK